MVIGFEELVDFGSLAFELFGLFEKGFGGDGEEFGVVGSTIVVEDGAVAFEGFFDLDLVFLGEDSGPCGEGGLGVEDGDAIAGAVFLVELMGEFVEGDVFAVGDVACSAGGGVPCEDDGAAGPGFAEAVDGSG